MKFKSSIILSFMLLFTCLLSATPNNELYGSEQIEVDEDIGSFVTQDITVSINETFKNPTTESETIMSDLVDDQPTSNGATAIVQDYSIESISKSQDKDQRVRSYTDKVPIKVMTIHLDSHNVTNRPREL